MLHCTAAIQKVSVQNDFEKSDLSGLHANPWIKLQYCSHRQEDHHPQDVAILDTRGVCFHVNSSSSTVRAAAQQPGLPEIVCRACWAVAVDNSHALFAL